MLEIVRETGVAVFARNLVMCFGVTLALAGCAGNLQSTSYEMTPERVERIVRMALEDIRDVYYQPTTPADLVTAGMTHIDEEHKDISFVIDGVDFETSYKGVPVDRFPTGPYTTSPRFWGTRVATTLNSLQAAYGNEPGPDLKVLTNSFLQGVASSLSEYTKYNSPEAVQLFRDLFSGDLGTINVRLRSAEDGLRVAFIAEQDPVDENRLHTGDLITSIDGVATPGLGLVHSDTTLIGPVASVVAFGVTRSGKAYPAPVLLRRQKLSQLTLLSNEFDGLLHLKVRGLNRKTESDLADAVRRKTPTDGTAPEGIVLDLRGNSGGLLDAVVGMSDTFVQEGRLFSTRGRHPDSLQYFNAAAGDMADGLPLVVLVDANTASGAEIVASALQDSGRAVIIGQSSFGFGTVQTVLRLPNRGELALTWAEMITAGGYPLDQRGVLPTVCSGGNATVASVITAQRGGGGIIDRATRTREIDPADNAALEAHRALCPPRVGEDDISLEVAKAILDEPGLYAQILARDTRREATAVR